MRIKLIHLFSDTESPREIASYDSVSILHYYDIQYKFVVNPPFKGRPPRETCVDPEAVKDVVSRYGATFLGPGHYGCYAAHKKAILEDFDPDLDFLMICECDCLLNMQPANFVNLINNVCETINREKISYFSFGGYKKSSRCPVRKRPRYVEPPRVLKKLTDNVSLVNFFIETHCIIFPCKVRGYLQDCFGIVPWDTIDHFYNSLFSNSCYLNPQDHRIGVTNFAATSQAQGYSLINTGYYKPGKKFACVHS